MLSWQTFAIKPWGESYVFNSRANYWATGYCRKIATKTQLCSCVFRAQKAIA